ncbi:hypothetical protein BX666DRAFT_1814243, partial [Dichotomocladium elegans]
FFVFDLSILDDEQYRVIFTLFEIAFTVSLSAVYSHVLSGYSSRTLPRLLEPTFFSRRLSGQGFRLRIRKEHQTQM